MLKQILVEYCKSKVLNQLQQIKNRLDDIQESFGAETKSSAGDKFETARAMLQIDREKLSDQFTQNKQLIRVLDQIEINKKHPKIQLGSIVYTSQFNYFISISIGEIKQENENFYAIGPSTPIGKLLLGKSIGDEIIFNQKVIQIKEIL